MQSAKQSSAGKEVLEVANEWKVKGDGWYKNKKYANAKKCYNKGIQCVLNSEKYKSLIVDLLCNRAFCFMKMGKWESAILDAGSVMQIDRKSLKAWFRLISSLIELNHFAYARDLLLQAFEIFPNAKCLKNVELQLRKISMVDNENEGENKSQKSNNFAFNWCSVGRVGEIVDMYDVRSSPSSNTNTNRNENRGMKSKRKKKKNNQRNKNKRKIKYQSQTENKNKNKLQSKSLLATMLTYKKLGNSEAAIQNYEEAINFYSTALIHIKELSYLYSNLGALLFTSEKYNQAFECSAIALALNQRNIKAFQKRANIAFNFELFDIVQNICDRFPRLKQFAPIRKKLKQKFNISRSENLENKMEKQSSTGLLSDMSFLLNMAARANMGLNSDLLGMVSKVPEFHKIYERQRRWPKCANISKCKAELLSAYEHASAIKLHEYRILEQNEEEDYFLNMNPEHVIKRLACTDKRRLQWYLDGYPGLIDEDLHEYNAIMSKGYVSWIFHSFSNTYDSNINLFGGKIHIAVGFCDLRMLATCKIINPTAI